MKQTKIKQNSVNFQIENRLSVQIKHNSEFL